MVALRPAETLLRARSVAIVGVFSKGRWTTIIFQNLKKGGYPGKVYSVTPNDFPRRRFLNHGKRRIDSSPSCVSGYKIGHASGS